MKIQINGFDIEVNTEEANLSIKVLDANGKELSNNTYTQTTDANTEVQQVDVPPVEDNTADTGATADAAQPEGEESAQPAEPLEGENEPTSENFFPDYLTFKQLRKDKKI